MSQLIQTKIDSVRRKHAAVRAAFGASTVIIIAVAVISLTMIADFYLDLPHLLRAAMLAIHVAALLVLIFRTALWPLIKGPDDETVALWIESFYPDSASRIISAVQFSRTELAVAGVSTPMIGAAVKEAEAYIQPKDTAEVIPVDDTLKRAGVAMLLVIVAAGLFLWGRPNTQDLFLRAIAVPGVQVPRKTHVDLETPQKLIVAKGDTIQIVARARGVVPSDGALRVKYSGGSSAEFLMKPDRDEPEKFAISIENVQDSFTYRVLLNDGRSDEAAVESHVRPAVAGLDVQQQFPAYTKLKPAKRSTGDLTLLSGSRLQIKVTANKGVKNTTATDKIRNRVKLEGSDVEFPLRRDANDPKTLFAFDEKSGQASIPLPKGTTGMSVQLIDDLGLVSKDSAVYRIELVPDAPPRVTVTAPEDREELVTERAYTKISYQIEDDFGITNAKLRYLPVSADVTLEGDGFTAAYYANENLEGDPVVTRIEPKIEFNFKDSPPVAGVPNDHFSIRYTGRLMIPQSGLYQFFVAADDGVRLWVGNDQLIDAWGTTVGEQKADPVQLDPGFVDIRLEYKEVVKDAAVKLTWQQGGERKRETIPTKSVFSSEESIRAARAKRTVSVELGKYGDNQRNVRGEYTWQLSPLRLQPGDALEWWVEGEDANDQTGPGRTESEHRTVRIGTEAQVREYLLAKAGNFQQKAEELKTSQEDEAAKLGSVNITKPGTKPEEPRPSP
jgi:hypothetical protein